LVLRVKVPTNPDNNAYYVILPSLYEKIKAKHFDEFEALLPWNIVMKDIIMLPICNVGHQWQLCVIFNPKLYCMEGTLIYDTDSESIATNPSSLLDAAFNDDCSTAIKTDVMSNDNVFNSETKNDKLRSVMLPDGRDDDEVSVTHVIMNDMSNKTETTTLQEKEVQSSGVNGHVEVNDNTDATSKDNKFKDKTEQQDKVNCNVLCIGMNDNEVIITDMIMNDVSNETELTASKDREEQSSDGNRLVETNDNTVLANAQ
jgi:hypothetical protein